MHKLRVNVDGTTFEVTVEILEEPQLRPQSYSAAWVSHTQPPPTPPPSLPVAAAPAAAARPAAPSAPAAPFTPATPSAAGAILSPLAGKVVAVDVKPGMEVAEGVQVVTLEAMKMNTFIYAPTAGTVAAVHVNPGDAVEEGAALLTIV